MVGPLLSVAGKVPWGLLIDRMPDIIDGASRLMKAAGIARKSIPASVSLVEPGSNEVDSARLKATVNSHEESLLVLNKQMHEAAELIKDIAETNKLLVRAGALHRRWLIGLGTISLASLGLATLALLAGR